MKLSDWLDDHPSRGVLLVVGLVIALWIGIAVLGFQCAHAQTPDPWASPFSRCFQDTTIQVSPDSSYEIQSKVNEATQDTFLVEILWVESNGLCNRDQAWQCVTGHWLISYYDMIARLQARRLNIKP